MLSQSIVGHGTNREVNDFYPTSPEYTEALLAVHKFHGSIWEPACGAGDMSQVLEEHGYTVYSSDLYSRGYGVTPVDFLRTKGLVDSEQKRIITTDNVITNPPYTLAQKFIEHALEIVPVGGNVAMLLKLAFLEGISRKTFHEKSGLKHVYVFSHRIRFDAREVTENRAGGMVAFAWYVWEKGYQGKAEIGWL